MYRRHDDRDPDLSRLLERWLNLGVVHGRSFKRVGVEERAALSALRSSMMADIETQTAAVKIALDALRADARKLQVLADALLTREGPSQHDLADLEALVGRIASSTAELTSTAVPRPTANEKDSRS